VVAFEGDFLLGSPWWDAGLAADPEFFSRAAVWDHIDAYDGAPIHVLVDHRTALSSTYAISGFGATIDEFMALRDPDGSLTADLRDLGALDDGDIDLTEFNVLFHHRLTEAGTPTSLTWIDAATHRFTNDAFDAIVDLLAAE
jgi:hypothetical protein